MSSDAGSSEVTGTNLSSFYSKQLLSIADERSVDVDEVNKNLQTLSHKQLVAKGLAINNLTVAGLRTGLGGKTILNLCPSKATGGVIDDPTVLKNGDIVGLQQVGKGDSKRANGDDALVIEGVVLRSTTAEISVAVDESSESNLSALDDKVLLTKLANSTTYKRMIDTIQNLEKLASESGTTALQRLLLGNAADAHLNGSADSSPLASLEERFANISIIDSSLNQSQQSAVKFALDHSLSIVHGPPGTGKTYTLIEIIRQLVQAGERVLVCGPSNISVDNILERLHHHIPGNRLIRIGHPARLLESNLLHSLDIVSRTSDAAEIVKDIRNEIDSELKKVKKTKSRAQRKEIYANVKELRKDFRRRERKVVTHIINEASVVVSTLHGAGSYDLIAARNATPPGKTLFDTIIIDEVSQALEAQCWIPLCNFPAKRLVIAGDNKQLPPTVKSAKYKQYLETTLFDRLDKKFKGRYTKLLNTQYRMNSDIMDFPSQYLYEGKLLADASVKDRTLSDLDSVESPNEETDAKVIWIDTQNDGYGEQESDFSKYNEQEAHLLVTYITDKLVASGISPKDIGVIAPYSAQVRLIKELLKPLKDEGLEISTVDGFQGREKEAIVMSLVRSNEKMEVGFLAEERRLNVAITRPRRHLCIIGDMNVARGSKFLKEWVQWAEDKADIYYPEMIL